MLGFTRIFSVANRFQKDSALLKLVIDHNGKGKKIRGLYLVTDQGGRLLERVREALSGGASVLQYRDKVRDFRERLVLGRELKFLCARFQVSFIVNDDLELATALDADGLHLGQEDGDPVAARAALGPDKILGVSTHSLDEALAAQAAGADYVGFGAIYPTASKEVPALQGPGVVATLKAVLQIPVVAIGGITRDNAGALVDCGVDAIAVISSVLSARSPGLAAS